MARPVLGYFQFLVVYRAVCGSFRPIDTGVVDSVSVPVADDWYVAAIAQGEEDVVGVHLEIAVHVHNPTAPRDRRRSRRCRPR